MDINTLYQQYDFNSLEEQTNNLFPDWNISLDNMFQEILEGDITEVFSKLLDTLGQNLAGEVGGFKTIFISLLLVGIISAVCTNLSGLFAQHQLSDCGFYVCYLIMIIFLTKVATYVYSVTAGTMESVVTFLKLFLPTYFLTVGVSGGSLTAMSFYNIFMLAVFGVEMLLIGVVLPGIGCYMILCIVNGIWKEEKLEILIDLLKKGISFILKTLIALVSGTGLLQAMITPVIDAAKNTSIQKAISIIPGLGDLAGSASQILLGSAVLIKNAAGIVMVIILFLLCILPLLKLFCVMAVMKGSAALMGMVADKRMTGCTNRMGDGVLLLFQTMLTSITFFLVLVSILAFTCNRGF